jgi:hypothetical protein
VHLERRPEDYPDFSGTIKRGSAPGAHFQHTPCKEAVH